MDWEITAQELKAKLEAGEDIEVVDIREAKEYEAWHIQPSRNLPVFDALDSGQIQPLLESADQLPLDKSIILYCRVGSTSSLARQILGNLGFDAYTLIGGIHGWSGITSEAAITLDSNNEATVIQIKRNGKGCLSYLIGSKNEALIVDPSVDVSTYQKIARRENLKITKVIETHVHADHLSRAIELCQKTGATYFLPKNDRVDFSFSPIIDGDEIPVGDLTLKAIQTPGHTGESVCLLAEDEILLTGDTLFVNSVGRPDLENGEEGAEYGARQLYQSLHHRILTLPGNIRIFPSHHGKPFALDGKSIEAQLSDLKSNLPFLKTTREKFIRKILSGLGENPPNSDIILAINEGKQSLGYFSPLDLEAGPNRCAAS